MSSYHFAIDGNEANVLNRVGSNVYAFELLVALEKLLRTTNHSVTVLLSSAPQPELPTKRKGWNYQVILPKKFWTQWALPLHLYRFRKEYDALLTPGHYAPRFSAIPYVSAVMDTAYLEYPTQFTTQDRVQLRNWTAYSVKRATKILAISEFTKASVIANYSVPTDKIEVVYPAVKELIHSLTPTEKNQFFKDSKITEPYILFVGTLQPRKNIETIIESFELFSRKVASDNLKSRHNSKQIISGLPKLVLAGKVGWLADKILARIESSPFKSRIVLPGFISEEQKKSLYQSSLCTVLVGIHEGFGIPPLEAMKYGSIPVVANATSLPEVVGEAGFIVDAFDTKKLAQTFYEVHSLSRTQKAVYRKMGREQAQKFSWEQSAQKTLDILESVVKPKK
jgi:glycosyltransferase involved in cell wall biosynthesis